MRNQLIRTLIVDDSAFVRKTVRAMLSRSPYIEVVGAARDGNEALELTERLDPKVITCDLVMPGMDGVSFVRQQMARKPRPILILTSSPQDGERALEAMEAGAVDFVQKPSALATDDLLNIRDQLVEAVKTAAQVPAAALGKRDGLQKPSSSIPQRQLKVDIVVIGISTGGPQALREVIPQLPAEFPVPIAIVLHMPVGYTEMYAEKLNEISSIPVKEAREGDVVRPGQIYLAQAGRHLALRRSRDGGVRIHLAIQPLELPHRPAADVLFQSAAEVYGQRVLGVVMTGMGSDGAQGAAHIKAQGGTILTEAEESCVIYGMPRSVVELGLSDFSVPLNQMARAILQHI
jgi:two-component system chemotaxis response regulator CheB